MTADIIDMRNSVERFFKLFCGLMSGLLSVESRAAGNRRLAKVAVQCSAETFVVNQTLVLRINSDSYRNGKNSHFAKPQNVKLSKNLKSITKFLSKP